MQTADLVASPVGGERKMEQDMATKQVRVLGQADSSAAVTILARAFDQEPAKLALLPNSAPRRAVLEMNIRARLYDALRYGLRYGTLHGAQVDGELGAVALWHPPGVPKLSNAGAARAVLALPSNITSIARAFPHIARMLVSDIPGMVSLVRTRRPAVVRASRGRTWRLDLLGTAPEHRRKGLARSLIERQLQRCDEDGAAIWLEATDPVIHRSTKAPASQPSPISTAQPGCPAPG
jgi:GNAT superfamily N-acetyltransferase